MRDYCDIRIQVQAIGTQAVVQFTLNDGVNSPIMLLPELSSVLGQADDIGSALTSLLFSKDTDNLSLGPSSPPVEHLSVEDTPRTWYQRAAVRATEQGKSLRLRLRINQTPYPPSPYELGLKSINNLSQEQGIDWISVLPWEDLLHGLWLTEADNSNRPEWPQWLAEHGPSLVRVLFTRNPPKRPPGSRNRSQGPLQVLLAWSEPQGFTSTFGEGEVKKIQQILENDPDRNYGITILEHVTYPQLKKQLSAMTYDVVHILTHGDIDKDKRIGYTHLLLEDEYGRPDPLTGPRLAEVVCQDESAPQIVFVHACESATTTLDTEQGIAQSLVSGGVPYVVAMQSTINPHVAGEFAETFYQQLANREPVDRALAKARARLAAKPQGQDVQNVSHPILKGLKVPTWAIPVLFMSEDASGWLEQGPPPKVVRWIDGKVMILIESNTENFYVDKYPVTSTQYERYLNRAGLQWQNYWKNYYPEANEFPATKVSPEEAQKYAGEYCKTLPTLEQWCEAASGGRTILPYPWGVAFEEGRCNSFEHWGRQRCQPTPATKFPAQNRTGVCDIVGNIAELAKAGGEWLKCGGGYKDKQNALQIEPDPTTARLRFHGSNEDVGFRCVASVSQCAALLAGSKATILTDTNAQDEA